MKRLIIICFAAAMIAACNHKSGPDISNIKMEIPVERFDRDYFSMDTTRISESLQGLFSRHRGFYNDFMSEILGVSPDNNDPKTQLVAKQFYHDYSSIYDSLKSKYNNVEWLKKDLEKAFRYVKYYYPAYKTVKADLFLGPLDAPGVATTDEGVAIGLQQFAGKDFSVYQTSMVLEMFPAYISRRFSPEYIVANCMKAVIADLYPDKSKGKPLIEQMVEKGKEWYLLSKFLPDTPDSIKTGFTQQQLNWCKEYEGQIWSTILKNEDLNSINPTVIQTYIGEGPFTQGFSQEYSPGNLGQWIGWQIILKYVSKHPDISPDELMKMDARKILEEAKYKPK
jgi:hypothetical protein